MYGGMAGVGVLKIWLKALLTWQVALGGVGVRVGVEGVCLGERINGG